MLRKRYGWLFLEKQMKREYGRSIKTLTWENMVIYTYWTIRDWQSHTHFSRGKIYGVPRIPTAFILHKHRLKKQIMAAGLSILTGQCLMMKQELNLKSFIPEKIRIGDGSSMPVHI